MPDVKYDRIYTESTSRNTPRIRSRSPAVSFFVYMRQALFGKKCRSRAKLNERTVIITGGNAGIGKETSVDLVARGAKVIIACRDTEKGSNVAQEICRAVPSANIIVRHLDLASFSSIRKFAQETLRTEPYIHLLINNAGVAGCPKSTTEEGFEMQFGVNHLGHFLLTKLLLDRIKASAPSRIINVASVAHLLGKIDFNDINLDHNYQPLSAYGRSKLANVLFTRELAKKLKGTGVTTYCLHPGAVHTGLGQHLGSSIGQFIGHVYHGCSKVFFKSPKIGAQTTIYCAVEESLATESGLYYWARKTARPPVFGGQKFPEDNEFLEFDVLVDGHFPVNPLIDCTVIQPSARALDDNLAKKLWEVSESLVASTH